MLISANYKSTLAVKTNLPPDARLRAKVFGSEDAAANVCTFLMTPERVAAAVACLSTLPTVSEHVQRDVLLFPVCKLLSCLLCGKSCDHSDTLMVSD